MPAGFTAIMGGDQIDPGLQDMLSKLMPSQHKSRRLTVAEARKVLAAQEAEKLVDPEQVKQTGCAADGADRHRLP